MNHRIFISLVAIFLAVATFFVERAVIKSRAAELSGRRFTAFEESIELLDRIVKEKNDRGDYFRYIVLAPQKEEDVGALNPAPKLVETAVILDRNFVVVARSGRDLTDEERMVVRSGRKTAVTAKGLLRTYILTDFADREIAHLALALKPVGSDTGSALYVASIDLESIASIDTEIFGREDNLLLGAILARQQPDRETFRLHGVSYFSLRRFFLQENLVLFHVTALPQLYAMFSPYLIVGVLLLAATWLLHGYQQNRFTRRELSERTLHSYHRAIEAHASALDTLSRLTASDDAVQEKLVVGTGHIEDIEERIRREREAHAVKQNRKEAIVIDVMPESRQFRFMNPARKIVPATVQTHFDVKEQKLREQAFSDELKNLMTALEAKPELESATGNEKLLQSISLFQKQHRFPEIDQYLYYLNELYFDEVTDEELSQAMQVVCDKVQSHNFAIMLYDSAVAAFRCRFVQGVPKELMQILYLLPKDSIIQNDFADYGYVETGNALKKNPFFIKRFPPHFSDNLKGIHIFSLNENYLRARILFFDTARGAALSDLDVVTKAKQYLRQVAPALQMYFSVSDEAKIDPRDLAESAVRELRECTALGYSGEPVLISQYVFEDALAIDQELNLVHDVAKTLKAGEKVLLLSPSRIIVAHSPVSSSAIESLLAAQGKKFIIKESEFGKNNRNLYTFIEF